MTQAELHPFIDEFDSFNNLHLVDLVKRGFGLTVSETIFL